MRIDAVGFDLDGTLYPYPAMIRRSIPLFLRYPRFVWAFSGVRRHLRRVQPVNDLHDAQARLLAETLGIDPIRAREMISRRIYDEWMRYLSGIRPFPAVVETLDRLQELGLRIGVLSDYPVHRKLEFLGLEARFDCAFTSEDIGYLKPHPAPFLELARRLDVPAERILYVGDIYDYDVVGARRAGMKTAHISRRPKAGVDLIFHDYQEFVDLLLAEFA